MTKGDTGATTDLSSAGEVYLDDPRTDVADLMPPGIKVLDVGCSKGAFGAELKRRVPERQVFGIEPTASARFATDRLDEVVQGFFPAALPGRWASFDVVTFNDVLEHLEDPWQVLRDVLPILRPGGYVVASIPNVRYIDVIVDLLLRGEWTYRSTGVLDKTHLRFFTESSIHDLFVSSGFDVVRCVPLRLDESNRLSARVLRRIGRRRRFVNFLAQRYVVIARAQSVSNGAQEPT